MPTEGRDTVIDVAVALGLGAFELDAGFASQAGITALFGPSGAGKTTLLNAVAGLARPRRGRIVVAGETLFDADRRIDVPAYRRRIGVVFQNAQLLPHLSVRQNLAFGRWFRRGAADGIAPRDVIDVLGLGALLERRPAGLSGGERQRVAIGRALLSRPRLLLMDEPLAALDAPRKLEILRLIERVRDGFGVPILYVSHAVEEVARLAGHVIVLRAGRVVAAGLPETALAPQSLTVSEQRRELVSLLTARVLAHDPTYDLTTLGHPAGEITVPGQAGRPDAPARVVVRGTDVSLALARPAGVSLRTMLDGVVSQIEGDAGAIARVDLTLAGGDRLSALVTRKSVVELGLEPGSHVLALIKAASVEEGAGRP